jgi:16S rRNA (uracil1498-N3)-methyltransferase
MSLHRFFIDSPLPEGGALGWPVPLGPRDLRHLAVVLRMKDGDRVVLADGSRRQAEAVLRTVTPEGVSADVAVPVAAVATPRVGLAQGLARRERMETVIEKATELGAAEIVPVRFSRSVVKLDRERAGERTERWRRIALEAAKQSQRAEAPVVREPIDVPGLLELAAAYDVVLVPWEETVGGIGAPGIGDALAARGAGPGTSVLVVIGPAGGLEPAEVERLTREARGVVCSMGETVLRTETAAIVALALVTYALGGLGGRAGA